MIKNLIKDTIQPYIKNLLKLIKGEAQSINKSLHEVNKRIDILQTEYVKKIEQKRIEQKAAKELKEKVENIEVDLTVEKQESKKVSNRVDLELGNIKHDLASSSRTNEKKLNNVESQLTSLTLKASEIKDVDIQVGKYFQVDLKQKKSLKTFIISSKELESLVNSPRGEHRFLPSGSGGHPRRHSMNSTDDHYANANKLFYSDSDGNIQEITIGSDGEVLIVDSSTPTFQTIDPRKKLINFTDFFTANQNTWDAWVGVNINSGSNGTSGLSDSNHIGTVKLTSSTTPNSGVRVQTAPDAFRIAGSEVFEATIYTHTLTNTTTRIAFMDTVNQNSPTDGVYFLLSGTTASGKTAANGSISTTATTYTLTTSAWYKFRVEINSDASLVTFTIYNSSGVQVWSDTLSSNIPTNNSYLTGSGLITTNSGSSSVDLITVDYMYQEIFRSLTR